MDSYYLGGSCTLAPEIARRSDELRALGYDIKSHWTTRPLLVELSPDVAHSIARADFRELMASTIVVIDCSVASSSGGLESEIGISLGARKILYIIAPSKSKNVFATLATATFPDYQAFKDFLLARTRGVVKAPPRSLSAGRVRASSHTVTA